METFALVLDLFVVALLVPTIIFAVILNNRLSVLRKNKEELARLIAAFNEATVRAEGGIPKLRKASEDAGRAIQEKMERAQMLRDDLAFMVERADTMAGRLEEAVRVGRGEARAMPVSSPAPAAGKDVESMAEARERAAAAAERLTSPGAAGLARAAASDRSPLTAEREEPARARRAPLSASLGKGETPPRGRDDDERSEAERELLRALQSAR